METCLSDVKLIEPEVHLDQRGFFFESYNQRAAGSAGIKTEFVQDNFSHSVQGVLRGLHFQVKQPQAKLVQVLYGKVWDVVVDLRRQSPTYGQWEGFELDDQNHRQLFIPPGFAHGFSVLSPTAGFLYKVDRFWAPGDEAGLAYNDPQLQIDWKVVRPILNEKDQKLPLLRDLTQFPLLQPA